jgi:aminopeptidase
LEGGSKLLQVVKYLTLFEFRNNFDRRTYLLYLNSELMKRSFLLFVLLTATVCIMAQVEPDFDAIAENIVNHSLQVQPGEVVILSGTPAELDLLSAMYVAVSKAGGQATIEIGIPEANKRAIMETPVEYLGQIPRHFVMQTNVADCYFYAGSAQDPSLFSDVPEDRLAATRKANEVTQKMTQNAKIRTVGLGQTGGIPSPAYAELKGADYQEMVDMFWKSLSTDYKQMTSTAKKLKEVLKPGSEIHLTCAAGSDLKFKLSDETTRVNCGRCLENPDPFGPSMAFLPAGEVYTCVDPKSATGKLLIPSMSFRGQQVKNLSLTIQDGQIVELSADKNEDLIKEMLKKSNEQSGRLSVIDLGINPDSHPLNGSDHYSWEMAGLVTLTTGGNTWAGGDLTSDTGLTLHIAESDLSVDGAKVIQEGELLLDQLADSGHPVR